MKKILVAIVLCLAMGLSFWAGTKIKDQYWSSAVARETRHHKLVDLRTCFYAVEADTLRFAMLLHKEYLTSTVQRAAVCQTFIEGLGKNAENEELGSIMGQMLLFYNSYVETIKEILARQIMLQTLYNDAAAEGLELEITEEIRRLILDQKDAIMDTRRFLDEFEQLITQAW